MPVSCEWRHIRELLQVEDSCVDPCTTSSALIGMIKAQTPVSSILVWENSGALVHCQRADDKFLGGVEYVLSHVCI